MANCIAFRREAHNRRHQNPTTDANVHFIHRSDGENIGDKVRDPFRYGAQEVTARDKNIPRRWSSNRRCSRAQTGTETRSSPQIYDDVPPLVVKKSRLTYQQGQLQAKEEPLSFRQAVYSQQADKVYSRRGLRTRRHVRNQ